ncbi:MAG: hypothetical protein ACXACR_17075 [Candidatus Hodarchaeales archaeon]|jgi:hypothetical protein
MIVTKQNLYKVKKYMETNHPGVVLHNPVSHKFHEHYTNCGCTTNWAKDLADGKEIFVCKNCGAAYDILEVYSFYAWKCYDCPWSYNIG